MKNVPKKKPAPKRLRQAVKELPDGFLMSDGRKVVVERRRKWIRVPFQNADETGRQ
jgi:hypothetical protein